MFDQLKPNPFIMSKPVCTIVGMGTGVSLAVARKFGLNGFGIAMVARDLKKLTTVELQLKDEGIEAHSFVGNSADEKSLREAFNQIRKEIGDTDVLVYNAAKLKQGVPSAAEYEDFIEDFKVNVAGALVSVQEVIPFMKERKRGTIILTGGGLSMTPHHTYFSLAIGKAAIRNFTFSLAGELEPFGITVGTVTISGLVKEGTKFDPKLIADEYWRIHTAKGTRLREILFQ